MLRKDRIKYLELAVEIDKTDMYRILKPYSKLNLKPSHHCVDVYLN